MKAYKPWINESILWGILIIVTAALLYIGDIGPVSTPYTRF